MLASLLITLLADDFENAVPIGITGFRPCCLFVADLVKDLVARLLLRENPNAVTLAPQWFEVCHDLVAVDTTKAPEMGAKIMLRL